MKRNSPLLVTLILIASSLPACQKTGDAEKSTASAPAKIEPNQVVLTVEGMT